MKVKWNNALRVAGIVACFAALALVILISFVWYPSFRSGTVCFFLDGNLQRIEAHDIQQRDTTCRFRTDTKTVQAKPDTFWTREPVPDLKQTPLQRGGMYGYIKQGTIEVPARQYSIPATTLYWIEKE